MNKNKKNDVPNLQNFSGQSSTMIPGIWFKISQIQGRQSPIDEMMSLTHSKNEAGF